MSIPLDHVPFLAKFPSFAVLRYGDVLHYDLIIKDKCRAIIRFSIAETLINKYQGFLVFNRKRISEMNWDEDVIAFVEDASLQGCFDKIERRLKEFARDLIDENQLESFKQK